MICCGNIVWGDHKSNIIFIVIELRINCPAKANTKLIKSTNIADHTCGAANAALPTSYTLQCLVCFLTSLHVMPAEQILLPATLASNLMQ